MVWYIAIALWFWELLKVWGSLFIAPIYNLEMLWIIIPTYLNWIIADIFQEKKGTSLGNAISNAVIVLWASIDWSRTSIRFYSTQIITGWHLVANIFTALVVFFYGAFVVYEGIKGKNITHYIGRIRVVTYIVLMVTPLIYNSNIPVFKAIIAMVLFFPIFYFIVELIDKFTPDPISIREDEGKSGGDNFGGNLGSDLGGEDFKGDFKI